MRQSVGRPTKYTDELADKICALIASEPYGLKKLCAKYDWMPDHQTVKTWRRKHPEFLAQYLEAKELQGLEIVEDLWEQSENVPAITEEINLFNAKFRFQQFHLQKLAPKQFGDKKQVETKVEFVNPADALKQLE